ncbi:PIR protein [Plasmodium yoelii]|uniref:PIR protein n=3 Tax=Plasmodium yoelii TaxID=5861 RepID=A0AAF0B5F3_PLAYO|nr:PIR protein [Plasmodium yoelii]WBY58274.1 PIR protein [Plasmodium yoelii yoelii]VTZ79193.1 PIR protein [Plasmodium yoelii]|eukprot:XP_022810982.2 PIR protein [Plasmodium yoelii]
MSSNVCDIINGFDQNNLGEHTSGSLLSFNCPNNICDTYDKQISSIFIELLKYFENIGDEDNLESDQLAEYAILWLSYKLNQKTESGPTTLKIFYNEHIKENSKYNEDIATDSSSGNKISKDVIETKIRSMNIDIKDISNFYDAFKSLCNMYSEIGAEGYQCKTCLENAGELFEKYEKLKNALNINKGNSYYQLLSSLSNDYKNFEKKYSPECNNISLVACPRSSVTKNILISISIIFVAASILLGVSYKYSLFGFRKRFQKQHLREKLKK